MRFSSRRKQNEKKNFPKEEQKDDLDTETTFANMNVEGFRWYQPKDRKKGSALPPLSKEERRAMLRGAISAFRPILAGLLLVMVAVVGFAYLWLG